MSAALLGAAALLCSAPAGTPARAAPAFSALVVFGDSLSDTGNAGRFSNGPVWVEVVADRLGVDLRPSRLGGSNYAVGGARTHGGGTDLRGQVHGYLSGNRRGVDPDALYIVYAGANDLLAAGCSVDREVTTRTAAGAILASVDELAAAGGRHFLIPNLPDIGFAPIVRAQGAACVDTARRRTRAFNAALERGLREVEAKRSIRIRRLEVFALADEVMADPAGAGFRDTETPCRRGSCDGVLFYDDLHPSSAAHARLAAAALRAVGLDDGE